MAMTSHIPREFIEAILKREKDHRRFEEFVANLFSASEKIRYTTTAPTGDKGRDMYAELADGFAVACATTVQRDIKRKIKSDIDKHQNSSLFILRFRYCSNLSLSEGVRDEMMAYAKTKLPQKAMVMVLGLSQVVDRAASHQDIFETTYGRELAIFQTFLQRAVEDQREREQSDSYKVVLSCAFHPEMKTQREEVVRSLLFLALQDHKPKTLSAISARVGTELHLERSPRDHYLVEGIQRLIDSGEVSASGNGYVLTNKGIHSESLQLSAAATDALNGRELFLERLGTAVDLLTDFQIAEIWQRIQSELASRFLYGGTRFVQDLRMLGEPGESKSNGPEIQTFLSEMILQISQMRLVPAAKRAVIQALQRFADPNDEAFTWLSQIAVKYLVLCTLGLSPEVERQIQQRFANWIIAPDTHMLLSYLCQGDEGHPQCAGVLNALHRANAHIVIAAAVLEEAVHHATISHRNLDDLEQRYLQARRTDATITPFALVAKEDNAFVKSFAFLSDASWKRSKWPEYIGQFYGNGSRQTQPMRRLLEKELFAEHPADSEETHAVGRGYAKQQLGKLADVDDALNRKAEWDGRLLATMMQYGKSVPAGKRLILVTEASSIRRFYETSSSETHCSFQISRPATLAYALMFSPGSHMNLETVQRFIFSSNHQVDLSPGRTPSLNNVLGDTPSKFKRPSTVDLDLDERLVRGE